MSDPRPGVSVVIPTHNRRGALADLLEDLVGQRVGAPVEVLVVDSELGEDVSGLIASFAARGLDVRRVLTDNIIARKRNAGAAAGSGSILVFLDDDMRVGPGVIQAHVEAVERDPESISIGAVHFPDEWVKESNYYRFKDSRHAHGEAPRTVPAHRFVSMNFAIERALFERLGGFDETYRGYGGEDLDLGIRAVAQQVDLVYNEGADAEHREVDMNVEKYVAKVRAAAREGLTLVLERHPHIVRSIPTVRYCLGKGSTKDRAIGGAVRLMATEPVIRTSTRLLQRMDSRRALYLPLLYKVVTLAATRQGLDDAESSLV